jgi:flagellar basal-body rod protein FlgF
MDRSVYIAMTGATQTMRAQDAVSHNLANASTVGFKGELSAFQSLPVLGQGANTRINAVAQGVGEDNSQGSIQSTGRPLDVAVNGPGWIAVQAADGSEAYTRAGNLQIGADGSLTDSRGNPVMGSAGPITIPDSSSISVGSDGTISTVPMGQSPDTIAAVGQLKLVNPDPSQMTEGADGLMRNNDGSQADADSTVTVTPGALEASNVNTSSELVKMISLSRQYEMQVRSIKTAEDDADDSTKLLQTN